MTKVIVSTHAGQSFRGRLIDGEVTVAGHDVKVESIEELRLPIIATGASEGYVDLVDGTHIPVPTTWHAFKPNEFVVSGAVTLHVESLGKEVAFPISEIRSITTFRD